MPAAPANKTKPTGDSFLRLSRSNTSLDLPWGSAPLRLVGSNRRRRRPRRVAPHQAPRRHHHRQPLLFLPIVHRHARAAVPAPAARRTIPPSTTTTAAAAAAAAETGNGVVGESGRHGGARARGVGERQPGGHHGRRPPVLLRAGARAAPGRHQGRPQCGQGGHRRPLHADELRDGEDVHGQRAEGRLQPHLLRLHHVPRHLPGRDGEDGGVRGAGGQGGQGGDPGVHHH
mmetsp:Transcript_28859/g.71239  ORF Transcript_28859/g.71239 Transcript_28859/m.71239 type:complete len:230 (-) Transcript_28859:512-1201(-)